MAGLAYLLLPVTGLLAYFGGRGRTRLHGGQAVVLGVLWPAVLYACSAWTPSATQVAFVAGTVLWLGFLIAAAAGRDPKLPWVWRWLSRSTDAAP